MRVVKSRKKGKNIFLKLAVLAFCAYVIVTLVNQQVQISQKREALNSLNQQISMQSIKNEQMKRVVESSEEENQTYIERVARESLDFAKQGERVFINIAGN